MRGVFLAVMALIFLGLHSARASVVISHHAAPTGSGASSPFTALHTYFMSPTGNDSADGLTVGTAWATPNHAVKCGDVIVAAAGTYSTLGTFGTVSNCPSTSGGIDGTGGVYFAVVLCGGSDLVSCPIHYTGSGWAADVKKSNWAVEGFQTTRTGGSGYGGFAADGHSGTIHHVAFINDIAYNVGIGFVGLDNGTSHDVPGATGFDYEAFVGDIAQNAEQDTVCTAAMAMAGPASIDNNAGTHHLWYGNFSYNEPNNGCTTDVESLMQDTWDAHGVVNQSAILNNIGWSAWRFGILVFTQNFNNVAALHTYVETNTLYNNNLNGIGGQGGIDIQQNNAGAMTITLLRNVSVSTQSTGCAALVGGVNVTNITAGTSGNENVFFAAGGGSNTCAFNGFSFGPNNLTVNPVFTNTADLFAHQSGPPNCAGFATTTACMGWNANTGTLTIPSVISDLTPTCAQCGGKGYQRPSETCAANALYPTWLKGIVYLHWNGTSLTENPDLVTKPCGL